MPFTKRRLQLSAAALVTIIVIAAGVVYLSKNAHSDADAKPGPTEIHFVASDLAYLSAKPLASKLEINGNLEARSEAVVRAKAALDVKQIPVREGDTVHAGQLLAQLDTAELHALLAEKISTRDSARATFELAEKNRTNNKTLLEKKFISQNAFDSSDSTYKANQATLEAAEAQVEVAKIALSQATITSPIAGIVAKRFVKVGEKTSIDGQLFSIVDLDSLELQALVPAAEVTRLAHGMHAEVHVDGIPDQAFPCTLDRISPATEPGTRSVLTFFTVANPKHLLRSGVYANGFVDLHASSPVPSLPLTAIGNDAGQPIVWTVENGVLNRRPVELGLRDVNQGFVEIRKGVAANVPVVATKLDDLKEGAPARAVGAVDTQATPTAPAAKPQAHA